MQLGLDDREHAVITQGQVESVGWTNSFTQEIRSRCMLLQPETGGVNLCMASPGHDLVTETATLC